MSVVPFDDNPSTNAILNAQWRANRVLMDDLDSDGEEKMSGPGRGNARSGTRAPYFLHPPSNIMAEVCSFCVCVCVCVLV